MTFDDFADQVESPFKSLGWAEIQVAEFISPRTGGLIRAFKEGSSVLETGNLLQSTRQYSLLTT
ncbi:hypothetical protein [Alcaligenes faecalis]|uniref:hypothetical protein n=1 Tax=Alcaligenes faecalis TaxID=511 RepID=UPI00131C7D99|nr:hypothetical protein [Alcaligenes faecalis]